MYTSKNESVWPCWTANSQARQLTVDVNKRKLGLWPQGR